MKTLVFVDDLNSVLPRTVLRVRLAESISEELMRLDLVPFDGEPLGCDGARAIARAKEQSQLHELDRGGCRGLADALHQGRILSRDSSVRPSLRPTASIGIRVMHFDKGGRVYPRDRDEFDRKPLGRRESA